MDNLIIKTLNGEATTAEIRALARWMRDEKNEARFRQLKKAWHLTNGLVLTPEREEEELQKYIAYIRSARHPRGRIVRLQRVAAIALPLLCIAALLYLSRREPADTYPPPATIQPGTSKALLVLHDRRTVELDADRGITLRSDSILSRPTDRGVSILPAPDAGEDDKKWNHLITPRGGEYRLTLSDGTRVHLNAGTVVEFPSSFARDRREVRLTGEAYFEVAGDARPFIVIAGRTTTRVHGTTFNINAHENARARVVLVTGRVSVSGAGTGDHPLLPSQLAEFDADGRFVGIREVDARAHTAWTSGFFTFENEDIASILATLSRWYDVEVSYIDDSVKDYHFTGSVQRYENIDTILNAIGKTVHVHFSIRDRMIIVSKITTP
ncbi:MAG: DUF4974 domain-containing protein [Odoribacteraceae bacterium]|jgi:ferric-dicitrate binding protein FerR (iron transport regulator)|nr:DUF4974 domain-containing protein [Odoribacteraceae bacterium]